MWDHRVPVPASSPTFCPLLGPQDEPQPCLPLGSVNTISSLATPLLQHSTPPLPRAPSGSLPASAVKAASTQAVSFGVEASQSTSGDGWKAAADPGWGLGRGHRLGRE